MTGVRYEQETVIRLDETGQDVTFYTASKRIADKLRKAGFAPVKVYRAKGMQTGWTFRFRSVAVIVKPGKRAVRRVASSKRS